MFIHDALDELITCGETDIAAASLRVRVNRLSKTVPGKGITGFVEQFQVCVCVCVCGLLIDRYITWWAVIRITVS